MKHLKIFIIILLVAATSCSEDFLNLAPPSYLSSSTFYQTEEHFNQALSGTYQTLRGLSARQGYLMGEMRSDNTHYTLYEPDRGLHIQYREQIANFLDDSQNQWTNEMYYACYNGIARANTILDRIETVDFAETTKTRIMGEARFLRALFYFYLVRYYGGVPLYLHEVTNAEQSYVGRSSVDEVYAQIASDATFAVDNLPAPPFPQNGRATKGSAKMLLAKVFMTKPQRDYPAAEQNLRDIMGMGYQLLPQYVDVFSLENKNSRESIFEIQYQMGDQGQNSNWIYFFAPKTQHGAVIFGNDANTLLTGGWNVPNKELVDLYETGDTRLNVSIAVAEGTGGVTDFIPTAVKDPLNYTPSPGVDTFFYFNRKVLHAHAKKENTDDNWPVFRYSDALLSLAECLVYQGKGQSEANALLKQVRQRAGTSLPDISATEGNLALERRKELAFENHRWFDLVRTGKAIEVMNAYGARQKLRYSYLPDRSYNVTESRLIFPIPFMELQLNDLLSQNPGYTN